MREVRRDRFVTGCLAFALATMSIGSPRHAAASPDAASDAELAQIAIETYLYAYPLISMEITRRQTTNVEPGKGVGGPMNTFFHFREYPPADLRVIVRPNFDTLYSAAWLDLTKEPVVVSSKDTGGRYYMLPMLDMWTDVFASPGKRTSGTKAGAWAVVPPGWRGELPAGVERIDAPTPHVWLLGRTQTDGPSDYDTVHKVQDGYAIVPLSRYGKEPLPVKATIDPSVDMKTPPLEQVNRMTGADYFKLAAEVMKVNPPHATDWSVLSRAKRIGLVPGKSFDVAGLDPAIKKAVDAAPAKALELMLWKLPKLSPPVHGWIVNTDGIGVYGNSYLQRAILAMAGLGANQPEDAVYPLLESDADGKPVDGANDYVLHFTKEGMPPVGAFWSVTMYDAQGFQVANPLHRFAVSSWMPFKLSADGSLDLYLQHDSPGADKEANWLPAPRGPLGVTMRLYWPGPEILSGRWSPPALQKK